MKKVANPNKFYTKTISEKTAEQTLKVSKNLEVAP